MPIHVVGPDDGEQSGGGPVRHRIIEDGSHTQHRLGLIEAIVPPGPGGPPQHVHHEHDEIFIVTQGKLRFTSGFDSVDVEAGSCVTVPPGTPHTFANPFGEPAKFVGTLTPDLYVEYFRDLSRLPVDDKGQLNPADIGRTMAKYATEVIRLLWAPSEPSRSKLAAYVARGSRRSTRSAGHHTKISSEVTLAEFSGFCRA